MFHFITRYTPQSSATWAERFGPQSVLRAISLLLCLFGLILGCHVNCLAEEPYQRFLEKLRDEQLFDLALVYLAELEKEPGVSDEFKADLALERGMLQYSSAAVMSARNAQRNLKLDQAEQSIRQFLNGRKVSPRRGEAQLSLGNLLLTRAEEAKVAAGEPITTEATEAIRFYTEAHQLFQDTIQELAAVLEKIKGARTEANDTKQVEYRDRLHQEIRRAQLLSASAIENRGRSRVAKSAEWKKDLDTAEKMYTDLYMKEKEFVAIRNYAVFYRSGVQELLDKRDDAIDGYQRVIDQEGVDFLRTLQTQAMSKLIPLLVAQGKFPVAVERGEKWEEKLRPEERQSPETLEMKLELCKARLNWVKELEKKDKDDRSISKLRRESREQLQSLARARGPQKEAAQQLLASLGVEPQAKQTVELPKVKTFGEAIEAATERIQEAETALVSVATLQQELAEPTADKELKAKELAEVEATVNGSLDQAIALLQDSLVRFHKKAEREQLFDARQKLAYSYLKRKRAWEAIAISEFLSTTNPGKDSGLQASSFVLNGYSELLKRDEEDTKELVLEQLLPFAEFLVATWPNSEEAAVASSVLVQQALKNKQWDRAESLLQLIPESSETAARLRREAGMQFYRLYIEEKRAGADAANLEASRKRTIDSLKKAVDLMKRETIGGPELESINTLAQLYIEQDQLPQAIALVDSAQTSPLAAIAAKGEDLPANAVMDSYRTALQVEIGRLATDGSKADASKKNITDHIQALETVARKDESTLKRLERIYVQLSRDTKELLAETKMPERRKRLAEALLIVASEAGKRAEGFNTKYWSAATLLDLSNEYRNEPSISQTAAQEAASVVDVILAKSSADGQWMPDTGKLKVNLLRAKSLRAAGKFKDAINSFSDVLKETPGLPEVQLEAALTYQAWGDSSDPLFHKAAIEGGRPTGKGNLIWGFGKLSKNLAGNPDFTEVFFEARYQLASSRFRFAKKAQADQKPVLLKQAIKEIESTAQLYPSLGGPAKAKEFEELLRVIQKEAGMDPIGFAKKK